MKQTIRPGKVLPIAIMAFAIVGFLLLVDLSTEVFQGGLGSENTNTKTVNVQAVQPTTGWKDFQDPATGVSFKHPADYVIRQYQNPTEIRLVRADDPDRDGGRTNRGVPGPGWIGVTRFATQQTDLAAFAKTRTSQSVLARRVLFNGGQAIRVTGQVGTATKTEVDALYINQGGRTWEIRLDLDGVDGSAPAIFARLLTTLRWK